MKNRPILSLSSFKKKADIVDQPNATEPIAPQQTPVSDIQENLQKKEAPKKIHKAPKQRYISDENYNLIYAYFNKNYPICFPDKKSPVPLAIGIHNQIRAIEDLRFSKSKIFKFLARYAKNALYREQLVAGNNRLNLDGSVSSQVSEEEALQNKELLTKINTNKVTTTKAKKERVAKNIQLASVTTK